MLSEAVLRIGTSSVERLKVEDENVELEIAVDGGTREEVDKVV